MNWDKEISFKHIGGKGVNSVNTLINLVPKKYINERKATLILQVTSLCVLCVLSLFGAHTVSAAMTNKGLESKIAVDNTIVKAADMQSLGILQSKYSSLLGIVNGADVGVPSKGYEFTKMMDTLDKDKPSGTLLVGTDGSMQATGEYAYRFDYYTTNRASIPEFLAKLQNEKFYFVSISSIAKIDTIDGLAPDIVKQLSLNAKSVLWKYSVTVRLGGASTNEK